ncbi:MAG: glutamate-cysteine ligase family protein [Lachnospiraceae bacterium]|nr:glutamate-cysteine ligase family protein [Lachnospiraceae bacterium]
MSRSLEKTNLNLLVRHFEDGCKANCVQKLGVEIEHFIVEKKTGRSVSYYGEHGVEYILNELVQFFPKKEVYAGKHLIGMYNNDYSISIEPAGQLEISIVPKESISVILVIYKLFLSMVEPVLNKLDYKLVTLGYHPVSRAGEMALIPKKRYEYMDEYFKTSGTCGFHMMRGTASTQVSIDFCSEKDFVQKYRVAYQLMPALKLLTDNTPYFDGKPFEKHLARTYIWDHVDPKRCGILPNLFSDDFGFEAYAEYLWNLPMIFVPQGESSVYTGSKTAKDLWADRPLAADDIDHILSMTFLDVRLKHYIEIRIADSMPPDYVAGYIALIKGLFFKPDILSAIQTRLPGSVEAILMAQREVQEKGYGAQIYGRDAKKFLDYLIEVSKAGLDQNEKAYLDVFERTIREV